jgi:hypothetical protein
MTAYVFQDAANKKSTDLAITVVLPTGIIISYFSLSYVVDAVDSCSSAETAFLARNSDANPTLFQHDYEEIGDGDLKC